MWRRGGRSSALDRAQGLLAARRSGGGGAGTLGHVQGSVRGSVNDRSLSPSFSDLSEGSSVSLAAEPEPLRSANAGETRNGAEVDLGRPLSSLGGRSRFLKKPPPPTASSHSPERPEPRCVPSSQRSSQNAALSRLAAIESRIRVRRQALDEAKRGTDPANTLTSDISPAAAAAAATQSPVAPEEPTSASSDDHRLKGSRFLKNRATGATGAAPSESADVDIRVRTAGPAAPSGLVERQPMKVMSGVSLESDEEDMRRLLGDSPGSSDHSLSPQGQKSSIKKQDETSSRSSRRVNSTAPRSPPHAAASRRPSSPHRPPNSPPRRQASPFRFTGQARVCFSPSVLSPPPSAPPAVTPGSSHSLSSASGRRSEALSLEELFPERPHCEETHSDASSVSSADFMINVRSLDELVPATFGSTAETPRNKARSEENKRESKQSVTASTAEREQLEKEDEEEEEGEFYQSDFESESRSVQSASQVSEDVQGAGDEEEVVSTVSSEASNTSHRETGDDYSSAFSERSRTSFRRGQDSESSTDSRSSSERARRPPAARRTLKEAAVQTQPDPLVHTGWAGVTPPLLDFTPVLTHTLRAERLEALSTFNPALFTLNEMLKQQLAAITSSIQSSQQRHSRLLRSLEPPDYRYTTLEDVQQMMKKRRAPTLSLEEALEEVLQEMSDCFCT